VSPAPGSDAREVYPVESFGETLRRATFLPVAPSQARRQERVRRRVGRAGDQIPDMHVVLAPMAVHIAIVPPAKLQVLPGAVQNVV